ncbi:Transposable element P transposase [Frankliniella fusca]|uniref:Transposable element P transposase n=1 Tax=Frankliniella fusca TaxID=407009 RepID=A0AAE1HSH6_9NEOP|nr:Transposable element P transposase [Frankliniella fusca]
MLIIANKRTLLVLVEISCLFNTMEELLAPSSSSEDSSDDQSVSKPETASEEAEADQEHTKTKTKRKRRGQKKKLLGRKQKGVKKSSNVKKDQDNVWDAMKVIAPARSESQPGPSRSQQNLVPQLEFLNPLREEPVEDSSVKVLQILSVEGEEELYEAVVQTCFAVREDHNLYEAPAETAAETDIENVFMEPEPENKLGTIDEMEEDPLCDFAQSGTQNVSNDAAMETIQGYLLLLLPKEWNVDFNGEFLRITFLNCEPNPAVTRAITYSKGAVEIYIHNCPLPRTSFIWDAIKLMDSENLGEVADHLTKLASLIQHSTICVGVLSFKELWSQCQNNGSARVESIYGEKECLRHKQMKALSKRKNPRTIRWNPFVIKLALHLQMLSTSAYEYMQHFIKLPSLRTLYDFTHVVKAKQGSHDFILEDLMKQLPTETHQQYFNLEFDEISIHADIVIKKSTGEVVGYTNLREVEVALAEVEAEISKAEFVNTPATKALVFMAQGVTNGLIGVVGVYGTDCLSAGQLYSRAWDTIYNMESRGLKVTCLICDGASMNKKFFKMHAQWIDADHPLIPGIVYATSNLASCEKKPLYFIVDPPHLLKTLRNCLANSYAHKKSRKMWKGNEKLSWKSIELLYEVTKNDKFRSNKLTRAHINLSSHGCMKVIYACQTMSDSVARDLKRFENDLRFEDHDLSQLCTFIKLTNDAFDCWNSDGDIKGKRNKENHLLQPYTSKTDTRFEFLQGEFLDFFHKWHQDIQNRKGKFKKEERERMFISQQSYEALQITVHGFVRAIRFLLDKGATTIDGRKYNQDKLEQYFGIVRMARGASDNPSMPELEQNVLSTYIQGNQARPPKRGNTICRG